jgi:hypothetical protein
MLHHSLLPSEVLPLPTYGSCSGERFSGAIAAGVNEGEDLKCRVKSTPFVGRFRQSGELPRSDPSLALPKFQDRAEPARMTRRKPTKKRTKAHLHS